MKRFKQILSTTFTLFALCFLLANVVTVNAAEYVPGNVYVDGYYDAKDNYKSTTKKRMTVDSTSSIKVAYAEGDSIKKVKVNKKSGLTAKVTTYSNNGNYNSYSIISLYAAKAGTYKLTITVVDATGKTKANKKISVQVVNNSNLIKQATFNGQVVRMNSTTMKSGVKKTTSKSNEKVKGTSGKIKITPNSQYKITGIIVVSVGSNGKYTYKKIKNGAKINLSKVYENSYSIAEGYGNRSNRKNTYIYISYKDKFFGDTVKYSVTTKRGRKEIKCVTTDKMYGRKSTTYSKRPGAQLTLWQY